MNKIKPNQIWTTIKPEMFYDHVGLDYSTYGGINTYFMKINKVESPYFYYDSEILVWNHNLNTVKVISLSKNRPALLNDINKCISDGHLTLFKFSTKMKSQQK